ncbi:MAG TPA: hypothetical protein VG326_05795 [Tepidisphaeraceae bacterium]|jgi:hypothetical protein|nr:hypothetical protein [Tepidisphaeraceae bacterium]
MIRMNVVKWLAAGALALSVPAIGLAQHTHNTAGTSVKSVATPKKLSTGTKSTTKVKHRAAKLSRSRSNAKHTTLHSHRHKARKLTKSIKRASA